jgi:protocatechuate 3,4-dioxygenase beta subunit
MQSKLFLLLFPGLAFAQDFRASLNGRIGDPNGAPVSGAQVFLRDIEKNETQHVNAGRDGNYVFALVPPGAYEIRVTHPGFKTFTRSGLTLNVNQTATMDIEDAERLHASAEKRGLRVSSVCQNAFAPGPRARRAETRG